MFPRFARYSSDQSTEATKRYLKIAEDNDISLAQMALAFVNQQPFSMRQSIVGLEDTKEEEVNQENDSEQRA
mgnify:CR=1 FL=1